MSSRRWLTLVLSAVAPLAVACSSPPPPKPVEPKPLAEPAPAKPPAPPPKTCKALDDRCEAEPSTRAKIAGSTLLFTPAKGWVYAEAERATVAHAADNGPALAAAQVEIEAGKQEAASRDAALETLAQELKVKLPRKKVSWKKPLDTKDVAGMKIGLWQLEGAERGDKKGPLLVFGDPGKDGKALLGIGFVPDDDSSGADAVILQSIESISEAKE